MTTANEKTTNTVATSEPPADLPNSAKFTNAVIKEFTTSNGAIEITPFQKKLCQNYFIKIDLLMKDAEAKRLQKPEQYREPLAFTWNNVNMNKLAQDVLVFSSVGLDPTQPNHLNPIPFKNKATNKYDFTFIPGYKGIELKAKKYGIDVPDEVIVELVYSNDKFVAKKKDQNNKLEGYDFEIVDPFNRGTITGGFYYHSYYEKPQRNKLRLFTKADIDKRKPEYASADFWGGEKDKWENGQKVGKVEVEGWYDEMAYKTIYRAAYNAITIDSQKIDEQYLALIVRENETKNMRIEEEITEKGNKTEMTFNTSAVEQVEQITEHQQPEPGSGQQQEEMTFNNNPGAGAGQPGDNKRPF